MSILKITLTILGIGAILAGVAALYLGNETFDLGLIFFAIGLVLLEIVVFGTASSVVPLKVFAWVVMPTVSAGAFIYARYITVSPLSSLCYWWLCPIFSLFWLLCLITIFILLGLIIASITFPRKKFSDPSFGIAYRRMLKIIWLEFAILLLADILGLASMFHKF